VKVRIPLPSFYTARGVYKYYAFYQSHSIIMILG